MSNEDKKDSQTNDDNVLIEDAKGNQQEVSVEQLLGFDLTETEEVRGFPLVPEGIFEWRIMSWTNKNVGWKTKDGEVRKSLVINCTLQAISCLQCKNSEIDPTTLVGAEHTEGFFISKGEDLGRIKSFFVDIGLQGKGTVSDLCDQSMGTEFVAPIKHRKDKNDTSLTYANLDKDAIKPLSGSIQQIPLQAVPQTSGGNIPSAAPLAL